MKSIFTDKNTKPTDQDLKKVLGPSYNAWQHLAEFTHTSYKNAKEEWKYSGEKYGWNFQVSDNKRALIYLLPRDKFFKVGFVFGQKATDEIMKSNIGSALKKEIKDAKVYAEGRGVRIEVKDISLLSDLKKLIGIKFQTDTQNFPSAPFTPLVNPFLARFVFHHTKYIYHC